MPAGSYDINAPLTSLGEFGKLDNYRFISEVVVNYKRLSTTSSVSLVGDKQSS